MGSDERVAMVNEHMRLENEHEFDACIATFGRPRYTVVATSEIHDGAVGVEGFLRENKKAFPDFRFEPSRVTPTADGAVLVEGVFSGTHLGTWRGLPATGRRISFEMAVVFEFEGETMIGERLYFDLGTPLRQLGVARDPTSMAGRIATVANHPVTVVRALVRSLRHRRTLGS